MLYLVSKLLFCLLITLLLGLLLGWLASRYLNRSQSVRCKIKLKSVQNDHERLAEQLRDEKLKHQASDQKYNSVQAQWYELKRNLENEQYAAMRYKEMLSNERQTNVNRRFKLERNLTQREIRIDDLNLDLQNTRLQAARDLNRLNGRLRTLSFDEEHSANAEELLLLERDELRDALNLREQELLRINQQLQGLEVTDDQSTQELRQSAKMYSQLQDTYGSLNAEYEGLTERHSHLQDKLAGITQERDSLQTQMIDVGNKEEALELGLQSVGDEQGKLKAELTSVKQEANQCRTQYREARDELEQQRTQCRSITEHFAGMDKELAQSRMECAQIKARLNAR